MKKAMDHEAYPKSLRLKSMTSLHHIVKDATEAVMAMPNGENAGYYLDEINYASMELNRRMPEIRLINEEDAEELSRLIQEMCQIVEDLKKTNA